MSRPYNFKPSKLGITDPKEIIQKEILESEYIKFVRLPNRTKKLEKDALKHGKNASLPFLKAIEIVEAEKKSETTARVLYRFPVLRTYLNPGGTLHGGQQGALFDTATTWVIALIRNTTGFWTHFGTTRTLNITYLRPALEGEMLLMETEIVHAGKRLCLIRGILMRERDRAIISTCEHQKYNIDADAPKM